VRNDCKILNNNLKQVSRTNLSVFEANLLASLLSL